jgi:hypothetical protein
MSFIIDARRLRDPRFTLTNLQNTQNAAIAEQIQPDDLSFHEQSTESYSRLAYFDEGLNTVFNGNVNATYYTPFEPDFQYVTLDLWMDNVGNYVKDNSGFRNVAKIGGNPNLSDSINIQNGMGTIPSIEFDGKTTRVDIISSPSISSAIYNTALGFTIFCYVRPTDLTLFQSARRTIYAKSDNVSYGRLLFIDTNGDVYFHVLHNGIEYKVKAPATVHTAGATYQIIATFDPTLAINKATVTYPDAVNGDIFGHIGRLDNVDHPAGGGFDPAGFDNGGFDVVVGGIESILYPFGTGAFAGEMLYFRIYMRPLTLLERQNLWSSKVTIYDIPVGQVGLAGFCVANP